MPVADTSFLVAFFDNRDSRYAEARRLFQDADHVVISTEVLIETLGVIKTKAGRKAADACLAALMAFESVGWEETCDVMTAYGIYKDHPSLSFTDAVVVQHCQRLRQDVLTFDGKQAKVVAKLT